MLLLEAGVLWKNAVCVYRELGEEQETQKEIIEMLLMEIYLQHAFKLAPTDALVFGNQKDPESKINKMKNDKRSYTLLDHLKTNNNVWYLAKVDPDIEAHHGDSDHKEDSH